MAGDFNGDGIDDLIIGACRATPDAVNNAGRSYVVFGTQSGLFNPLALSDLDGSNGFVIDGHIPNGSSGRSVASAGDVNNDGIDDILIGAPEATNQVTQAGIVYLIYGSDEGFSAQLNLNDLNGINGAVINGNYIQSRFGHSVNAAGDVNNDGIDDIIIGAPDVDSNDVVRSGAAYIIFGHEQGLIHPLGVSDLNGINGFEIRGITQENSRIGYSVAEAGDVNADGISDIIIGSAYLVGHIGDFNAGQSYVVFGSDQRFPNPLQLSELSGSNGIQILGEHADDQSGFAVSAAGDINHDGIDDFAIGAVGTDHNGLENSGSVYVIYGGHSELPHPFNLSSINGVNGFRLDGTDARANFGNAISKAQDINLDGMDDIIIGAFTAPVPSVTDAGKAYVIYGSDQPIGHPFNLSALNGLNGFAVLGSDNDNLGSSVSGMGDFNNDGISDLIIGAFNAAVEDQSRAGKSYLIFGTEQALFANGFD